MKGNIIGYRNTPTSSSTSGMWSLQEHFTSLKDGTWPGSAISDPVQPSAVLSIKTIGVAGANNNSFTDEGPKSFQITRSGGTTGVTQGTFSPFQPSGYWSLFHDGTDCYTPNNSLLKMGTGDYTWECWVFVRSANQTMALYSDCSSGYNGMIIALYSNKIGVRASLNGTSWAVDTFDQGNALSQNVWTHLAVTRSGTTWRGFINGSQQWTATTATADSVYQNGNHYLCKDPSGAVAAFGNHYISNFRIVKGTALYTSDFTPSATPLAAVSGTGLLCMQDNKWTKDNSGNNLALTRSASFNGYVTRFAPHYLRTAPRVNQTGSIYFNGTNPVTTPNNTALNMGTGDFTYEYWWKPTVFTGCYHFTKGDWTTGFIAYISNTNAYLYINGGYVAYGDFNSVNLGSWNHVAWVRYNGVITIYLNGVNVGSAANTTDLTDTGAFAVGGYSTGGSALTGYISNFRAVKGTAVYTGNFTPPTGFLSAIPGTSLLTGQSSSTITDASPNKLTLTVGSGASASGEGFLKRAIFPYKGCASFSGEQTYLSIADNAALQMGTGDFTIEFWLFGLSYGSRIPIFQKGSGTGSMSFNTQGLFINNNWSIYYITDLINGIWNHIALVRSGSTITIYVNGVSKNTVTDSTNFNATGPLNIGYDDNGNIGYPATRNMTGMISNFRIVKGTAVYTTNFTPPTSPVTAISGTSLLLNFDNIAVYDSSGAATIETVADAKVGTLAKYSTGTTFDGGYYDPAVGASSDYLIAHQLYRTSGYAKKNYTIGNSDFTLEAWIRFASWSPNAQAIFDFGYLPFGSRGRYPYVYMYYAGSGSATPYGLLRFHDGSTEQINGTTALYLNSWTHVALCRSGYSTRLFVNGVQDGPTFASDYNDYTTVASYGYTDRIYLGSTYNGGQPFNGHIEDFRFTYGARYTGSFTPPAGPIA